MKRVISLLIVILVIWASAPAAQKAAEQPGPTLARAARSHRFDNMPRWKVDMVKRLEALDDAQAAEGGDSVFICEFPECACRIVTHGLVCVSTYFMDCLLHIFQPCKHIEITQ